MAKQFVQNREVYQQVRMTLRTKKKSLFFNLLKKKNEKVLRLTIPKYFVSWNEYCLGEEVSAYTDTYN